MMNSTQTEKAHVLVVDDQYPVAELISRLFISRGFTVTVVHDGQSALDQVRHVRPDLILMDVMMPGIDGFEVLSRLRASESTASIPTIMLTAKDTPADIELGLQLGADDYISKPIEPRELIARARSKIEANRLRAQIDRRNKDLEALLRVGEELNHVLRVDDMLNLILYLVLDLLPGKMAAVYLNDHKGNLTNQVVNCKEALFDPDALNHEQIITTFLSLDKDIIWPGDPSLSDGIPDGLAVALRHGNQPNGLILVMNDQPYDSNHLQLLRGITRQASLALRNAALYELEVNYAEELQKMVDQRTAELQSAQQMLIQAEKLAVVGRLSAAIAHEINNPLLPIKINLEHMAEDLREGVPIDVNDVEETRRSAERIHRIVDRLLQFTRKGQQSESSMELINLGSIIEHVVALSRKYCEHQGVQVVNQVTDLPLIYGNRDQLQQVFLNLVLNAVAAITESGTVRLTGHYEGDYVTVDVADDGCGIPSDMLKEIFEPFVSSKQDGSGLGLFISYEIIKNHQGQISVVSQVDIGTTFTVRIPVPDIDEIDQD